MSFSRQQHLSEVYCFNGQSDWNPWNAVISRVKDLTILKRCEQIVRLEKRTDMIGDADVVEYSKSRE